MAKQKQPELIVKASKGYSPRRGIFATKLEVRILNHDQAENMDVVLDGDNIISDSLDTGEEWVREIPLPGLGVYAIVVTVPGLGLRQRREVEVAQPATAAPYDLEIRAADATPEGVTHIVVTVVDAQERGVHGEFFVIRPTAATRPVTTDERGVAQLDLQTELDTEEIEFVLAGTSRGNKRITIRGPRPHKPRFQAMTREEARGMNPLEAFRRGWRQGKGRE